MEYFVFEGDDLWTCSDDELIALGTKELATIGLIEPPDVEAGYVVRMPKAYPVYDDAYRENVDVIRRWFEQHAPNVHPIGRNGMHKYNNQDHSMYTAMLTVENIHGAHHDIWSVNVEEEYHEEHDERTARPTAPPAASTPHGSRTAANTARSSAPPGGKRRSSRAAPPGPDEPSRSDRRGHRRGSRRSRSSPTRLLVETRERD